jgi:cytochrome c oxidase assembly protein subunit 15
LPRKSEPLQATPPPVWVRRLAWTAVAVNIAVVLWGAYVRASQSGAGCGSHWPLCNGEVIPQAPTWHRIVEFAHRVSSGLALVMVASLCVATFLTAPKKYLARCASGFAAFFMFNEALLGALLVLLKYVAMDQRAGRAVYLCAHSANTLLLLAAVALTAYWLTFPEDAHWSRYRGRTSDWIAPLGAAFLTLLAATTGAIAALGDTLFPASSLHQAWAQDFAANAHYALRLRGLHPISATLLLVFVVWLLRKKQLRDAVTRPLLRVTLLLLLLQYALGIADVLLLAPLWLQIVHLFGADIFWVTLVLLLARAQPRMHSAEAA